MNRPYKKRGPILNYKDDIQLFESQHFISVTNSFQKRSHLIIRSRRDLEDKIPNILEELNDQMKDEFWHMVQQIVADVQRPAMLCHHFGNWRSAPHFHIHIFLQKRDFAKYTAFKENHPEKEKQIIDLISEKNKFLVERHLNEFKKPEIEELKKNPIHFEPHNLENEYMEYKIELDKEYPWVKFIPKVQPKYSRDPHQIQKELRENRQNCFSAMYRFAKEKNFKGVLFFILEFFLTYSLEFGLN